MEQTISDAALAVSQAARRAQESICRHRAELFKIVNRDLAEFESAIDEAYPGSLLARLGRRELKVLKGFEERLRDLEKRFEDSEG